MGHTAPPERAGGTILESPAARGNGTLSWVSVDLADHFHRHAHGNLNKVTASIASYYLSLALFI
jgi:hypothetical protein